MTTTMTPSALTKDVWSVYYDHFAQENNRLRRLEYVKRQIPTLMSLIRDFWNDQDYIPRDHDFYFVNLNHGYKDNEDFFKYELSSLKTLMTVEFKYYFTPNATVNFILLQNLAHCLCPDLLNVVVRSDNAEFYWQCSLCDGPTKVRQWTRLGKKIFGPKTMMWEWPSSFRQITKAAMLTVEALID